MIVTRNGEADLVVMSHEAYERMQARIQLQAKLLVAEKQIAQLEPLTEHREVMKRIQKKIDAAKI